MRRKKKQVGEITESEENAMESKGRVRDESKIEAQASKFLLAVYESQLHDKWEILPEHQKCQQHASRQWFNLYQAAQRCPVAA